MSHTVFGFGMSALAEFIGYSFMIACVVVVASIMISVFAALVESRISKDAQFVKSFFLFHCYRKARKQGMSQFAARQRIRTLDKIAKGMK